LAAGVRNAKSARLERNRNKRRSNDGSRMSIGPALDIELSTFFVFCVCLLKRMLKSQLLEMDKSRDYWITRRVGWSDVCLAIDNGSQTANKAGSTDFITLDDFQYMISIPHKLD
jgi:hypothetical protein